MTAVDRSKALWNTMPGWGLVANLLPPEVIVARRVRVLRKLIVMVLVAVVALGAVGYGYASWRAHVASSALSAVQSGTAQLHQQQSQYTDLVQMQGTVVKVKGQIATLLANDVDVTNVISGVLGKVPAGAGITQLALALSAGSPQAAGANQAVLDTSGRQHIGTINITGQARSLDQVAAFVTGVATVPGIVGVFPTSQQQGGSTVQFSVQLTLTDQALSHRYAIGGK